MTWNAVHLAPLPNKTSILRLLHKLYELKIDVLSFGSGLIDSKLADIISLLRKGDPTTLIEAAGTTIALLVLKAMRIRGERLEKQEEFWREIIPPQDLLHQSVIGGGNRAEFLDMARRSTGLHRSTKTTLLRLMMPMFLSTVVEEKLEKYRLSEKYFSKGIKSLIHRDTTHEKLQFVLTLQSTARWLAAKGYTSNLIPRDVVRRGNRKSVLLPLGGPVSNKMAENLLQIANKYGKTDMYALWEGNVLREFRLSSPPEMRELRRAKSRITSKCKKEKDADEKLDSRLHYEIRKERKPLCNPYSLTKADQKDVYDSILIIAIKPKNRMMNLPQDSWTLSMQPLHHLGGIGLSIFHYPYETLDENTREEFKVCAIKAIETPKSIGFEAVLNIKCKRPDISGSSPRLFDIPPIVKNTVFEMVEMPSALVKPS